MRRELRDAHAVLSRLDHQTRKLFEPVRCKQKKAAEGPPPRRLYISIWLRTGRKAEALPLLWAIDTCIRT
jgi:hypothetical protein